MFGTLRKVFIPETDQENSYLAEKDNPNFITDPNKIVTLIQQIIESPPLCTVSIPNCNTAFFTSILEIRPEKGVLIFDSLMPQHGNKLLNQIDALKLSTFINGVHLSFLLQEVTTERLFSQTVYQALLPQNIYYPQRRSSPRIQTDLNTISFHGVSRNTGIPLKGYVFDISRTGLCVNFSRSGNNVQSGDKLTSCLIHLPDEYTFAFDLSLRSVRKSSLNNLQRMAGGFFNGLTPQMQHKLDRAISALERQQIRKRKN
ncbi:MAG: flagellar brake protein [Methylococcaceae bacterium]|nr:flagellar brake protein [Methylococcaceae bacterium]